MTARDILRRFGYDPDDPVPRDDYGHRIIPDKLLDALAVAPVVDEIPATIHRIWLTDPDLGESELEVLGCLSRGFPPAAAAKLLARPIDTVKSQLKSARYRLRARSTAHACCEAIRRGLIP